MINQTIDLVHVCLALQEKCFKSLLGLLPADEISGVASERQLLELTPVQLNRL